MKHRTSFHHHGRAPLAGNVSWHMWTHALANRKAIEGVFSGHAPALSQLSVLGLIVEAERMRIGLEWPVMPAPVPERWRNKRYDRLQIRLDLNSDDGLVVGGLPKPELCDISLTPGLLVVLSKTTSFRAEMRFVTCIGTLLPYRAADYEQGRHWYAINDAS